MDDGDASARPTNRHPAGRHRMIVLAIILATTPVWSGGGAGSRASAQQLEETVGVEAIRCWRRVSRNAVYAGQPFTLTVTCRLIETDQARTVIDEVALQPETMDVAPFEITDGQRFTDITTGPRRLVQYQYTLRLIAEDYFGQNAVVPTMDLPYRIEQTLDGGAAVPGRELFYVLLEEPIRIVSLVPDDMPDVRDIASSSFGETEARRFRASLLSLAAAGLGVLAFGALVLAGLRFQRDRHGTRPPVRRMAPAWAVAGGAVGELTAVQTASQSEGWSQALIGRALAALRAAAVPATTDSVAQSWITSDGGPREGQIVVREGLVRRRRIAISAAVTPATLTRRLETLRDDPNADPAVVPLIEALRPSLATLTAARYTRRDELATDELTVALDRGLTAARQLRARLIPPLPQVRDLVARVRTWWAGVRPAEGP